MKACESGWCCERCGKDVHNIEGERFFTIDIAKTDKQPDYYDICTECFDKFIILVREFMKGEADDEN